MTFPELAIRARPQPPTRFALAFLAIGIFAACDGDVASPDDSLAGACVVNSVAPPAYTRPAGAAPRTLGALGVGAVPERFTSELAVGGRYAYTGTWGTRSPGMRGDVLHVWDTQGTTPILSLKQGAPDSTGTIGDVQVSDDGRYLVAATEYAPHGSLMIFSLVGDPSRPHLLSVFRPSGTANGVHTAELARVDGKLYAFLSIDPEPSRLVVVDLTDPANPVEILSRVMGKPFVHDVFVRSGILFTALWNGGVGIWDIGGCGGGSPADPRPIATASIVGGQAHNVWWYHAANGSRRYAFVGQEGPGTMGARSSGDIHVLDVSDLVKPRAVAFFRISGAGPHNFSMDESRGILYAAYYNAGVRALDVRGDLGDCAVAIRSPDGLCDLGKMGREIARWPTPGSAAPFVWGVQWLPESNRLFASDMSTGLLRLDLGNLIE